MNNKQILGDLAMDLKRVAIGYFRGSNGMAVSFYEEALKRSNEIDKTSLKPYLVKLLKEIESLNVKDKTRAAEDALMYSTLFQNASITTS